MSTNGDHEHRRAERERKSVAMLWRRPGDDTIRIGWALEGSTIGCAFAWRGTDLPAVGDVIEVSQADRSPSTSMSRALVKRVSVAHGDLAVIAVRVFRPGSFPQAMESEAVIAEPRTPVRAAESAS